MGAPVTLVTPNPVNGFDQILGTVAAPLATTSDAASLAGINQTYRRSAAVGATAGNGVLVTGVTTAGTVNFTLVNGGSIVISVPLGSSNWPYGVTAATLGTAVGGTFSSLFFT